jgi:hypothetical protein
MELQSPFLGQGRVPGLRAFLLPAAIRQSKAYVPILGVSASVKGDFLHPAILQQPSGFPCYKICCQNWDTSVGGVAVCNGLNFTLCRWARALEAVTRLCMGIARLGGKLPKNAVFAGLSASWLSFLQRQILSSTPRRTSRAQVAQLVEQRTENPRVAGSIPALGTTHTKLSSKSRK